MLRRVLPGLFLVLAAVTCGGRSELSSGVTRATGSGGASATGSGGATGTGGGGGGAGPSSSMSTSMDCVGTGQSCTNIMCCGGSCQDGVCCVAPGEGCAS